MKIALERHMYAPELNLAYVGPGGAKMRAAGCSSISQVRARHFKPALACRYLKMRCENPEPYRSYDRTQIVLLRNIGVDDGNNLAPIVLHAMQQFRSRHNAPGATYHFSTHLIG